ncbi:MAG TPA: hypothetical protein PLA97_22370, partial [Rubrivivax sp.]|nr:hypothetical protein [Rubrivivax sp.]
MTFPLSGLRPVPAGVLVGLFAASVVAMVPTQPAFRAAYAGNWKVVDAGKDRLLVPPGTARALALFSRLRAQYGPSRPFLVVPFWSAVYAVHGLRS